MRQIAAERTEDTIPDLMEILDQEKVVYRRAAVPTLGIIGVDAVPPLVEQLIDSDHETVRTSCAKALERRFINQNQIEKPSFWVPKQRIFVTLLIQKLGFWH